MKSLSLVLLALLAPLAAGCGDAGDAGSAPLESEQRAAGNCSFIPGCRNLVQANDGPFSASVMTFVDAGGVEHRSLSVSYREAIDSSFLMCRLFPRQPDLSLVFVLGPEGAQTSVTRPMTVSCPTSWGDNPGATNTAGFGFREDEQPELWETLFPARPDGSRWFALQLAAANAHGQWESRSGQNFRLVLRPR